MDPRELWERVRPPLWARWTVALGLGAAAVVALVIFVHHNNNDKLARVSPKHLAQEAREARVVVGQDQAPRTLRVAGGVAAARLLAAVRADMRGRIASGNVPGPLQTVRCHASGHRGGRIAYSCDARAADVNYPFVGIADPRARLVTFCKRDLPPIPSENIPVSRRCLLTS